jgi:hypothetical protein
MQLKGRQENMSQALGEQDPMSLLKTDATIGEQVTEAKI